MKNHFLPRLSKATCLTAFLLGGAGLQAADEFITREEYDKVLQELEAIKAQINAQVTNQKEQTDLTDATFEEYDQQFSSMNTQLQSTKPGTSNFLLTGYGFAGYTDRSGMSPSFNVGFNPLFVWKLGDRFMFESELEIELEGGGDHGGTAVGLEYAQIVYLANDYLALGAGQFLSPFGIFRERLHPAWINKLPDAPLAFGHDGIIQPNILGLQARGGVPIGSTRFNYAVYLGNGPTLNVGDDEPEEAGMLHFNNYDNFGDNKAVGTRLGFMPFSPLEIGYSFQYSRLNSEGTSSDSADAFMNGVYLAYIQDCETLKGTFDVKAEWMWSSVEDLVYDPDGSLGFGPTTFDNSREGGYVQLAYRPSKLDSTILRNFEIVGRYDRLDLPNDAPTSIDTNRGTVGLNYWFTPSVVFKTAYQFGTISDSNEGDTDISNWLLQVAMGF